MSDHDVCRQGTQIKGRGLSHRQVGLEASFFPLPANPQTEVTHVVAGTTAS